MYQGLIFHAQDISYRMTFEVTVNVHVWRLAHVRPVRSSCLLLSRRRPRHYSNNMAETREKEHTGALVVGHSLRNHSFSLLFDCS